MRTVQHIYNSHATDKPGCGPQITYNVEVLVFVDGGKPENMNKICLTGRMRTNNKLNLHITPRSENSQQLGHIAACEVSAVTTARLIPVHNAPIQ